MRNKGFIIVAAALLMVLAAFLPALNCGAQGIEEWLDPFEHQSGKVYTMIDEDGRLIMRTARKIFPGDEYINVDNNYYRVFAIDGYTATARLVEKVVLADPPAALPQNWLSRVDSLLRQALPVQQRGGRKRIAIYNSHGAESYLKGDGTETKDPGGGILDVGDTLAQALEERGVEVIRSREPHTPHDAGAYQRSRRTVEEALKEQPDALVDVHRDAVPEEEYLAEVAGEERVQVQLVVGRQNQNMANNRQFAEGLKKTADSKYPNLVKGIFMARGNYNQDMSPRAILIEVGSHTNDKAQAEETVGLFAEVLDTYLYGTSAGRELAGGRTTPGGPGGTALRALLWVAVVLVTVVGLYLLISTGGINELKEKLRHFKDREFANFLGAPDNQESRESSGENLQDDESGKKRPPEGN